MEIQRTPPSEEELAARQAEARKSDAESQFMSLSEGKKKLTKDNEEILVEIKTNKEILEQCKTEVIKTKGNILDVQNAYIKENQLISKIIIDREESEKEFKDFMDKIEIEKMNARAEVNSIIKSKEIVKAEKEKEIGVLEEKKNILKSRINTLEITHVSIKKQFDADTANLESLKTNKENLTAEMKVIQFDMDRLTNVNLDLETDLKKKGLAAESIDNAIKNKNKELDEITKKVDGKQEEYKEIEAQAFVVLQRAELINQKELFIKSQFERAGVKWEE